MILRNFLNLLKILLGVRRVVLTPIKASILRILDGLRHQFEWVALRRIMRRVPYRKKSVMAEIKEMERKKMIRVKLYEEPYLRITRRGWDSIAIWDYVNHGEFEYIIREIGKGKEAEVYLVYGEKGYLVLKIHRYSKKEFGKFKRSFTYNAIEFWGERFKWKNYEFDFPRLKAKIEFNALRILNDRGIDLAPKPISINRHTLLMEFLGEENPYPNLYKVDIEDPKRFMEEILEAYERAVERAGIVHGDLNQYNILVSEDKFWFIDWPQSVSRKAPFWREMYERDLEKVKDYFKRRYGI